MLPTKTSATFLLSFILVFMSADDTRKNIYNYHEGFIRSYKIHQEIIPGVEMINTRFCIVVGVRGTRMGKNAREISRLHSIILVIIISGAG